MITLRVLAIHMASRVYRISRFLTLCCIHNATYCSALHIALLQSGVCGLKQMMDTTDLPSYIKTGVLLMCRCAKKPFFVGRILIVSVIFLSQDYSLHTFVHSRLFIFVFLSFCIRSTPPKST